MKQRFDSVDVHRLMEAILDGLAHEWVVRDLAVAGDVLETRDLIWKA